MNLGASMVLDAVKVLLHNPRPASMRTCILTEGGHMQTVILESPPILPYLLDRNTLLKHMNSWLESATSDRRDDFSQHCFPGAHEIWQSKVLNIILSYHENILSNQELSALAPHQLLRRTLKLVALNHVMSQPFHVPKNEVMSLFRQLKHYQPSGIPACVSP